jgi:hypothetical protein
MAASSSSSATSEKEDCCICLGMYACMHASVYACIFVHSCMYQKMPAFSSFLEEKQFSIDLVHTYSYIHMYVCIHIYIYIYGYINHLLNGNITVKFSFTYTFFYLYIYICLYNEYFLGPVENRGKISCDHAFCFTCIQDWSKVKKHLQFPHHHYQESL